MHTVAINLIKSKLATCSINVTVKMKKVIPVSLERVSLVEYTCKI